MATGLLITTAGAAAIAADLGGGADLVLTHVAFGDSDGVPYDPVASQTALVNERYRATIASVAVVANAVVIDAVLPADTDDEDERPSHGFNVAECGLFDTNGVLIGIARLGNGYKPSPESGQAVVATFRLKLVCTNPSAISVVIDPQAQVLIGRQVRPFFVAVDGLQNDPPSSPDDGDTYVIGATPTGAWTGFAHRIAQWVGVWSLATVPEGHVVVDNSAGVGAPTRYMRRTASGWETAQATEAAYGVARLASTAERLAGTSAERVLAARDMPYITNVAAAGATYYTDSGAADAYVLTSLTGYAAPAAYFDGMEINFLPDNDNTGASTVNVAGLGVKDLVNSSGGTLALGDISTLVTARYDAGLDKFKLQPWSRPEIGTYLLAFRDTGYTLPYDTWSALSATVLRNTLGGTFATGVFTAPRRGLYQFRMRASMLDNPSYTGTKWEMAIDASGAPTSPFGSSSTLWRSMGYDVSTIGFGYCTLTGGGELEMDAGETARIMARYRDGQGSGTRTLSNINMTIALLS